MKDEKTNKAGYHLQIHEKMVDVYQQSGTHEKHKIEKEEVKGSSPEELHRSPQNRWNTLD